MLGLSISSSRRPLRPPFSSSTTTAAPATTGSSSTAATAPATTARNHAPLLVGGRVDEAGQELRLAAIFGEVLHLAHISQRIDGEAGVQHVPVRQIVLIVGHGVEQSLDERVLRAPRRLQVRLLAQPLQLRHGELLQRLVGRLLGGLLRLAGGGWL